MRRLHVAAMTPEHLHDAARLVASEQEQTVVSSPGLSQRYLDPAYCRERLAGMAATHAGAVALQGDRVVGLLHSKAEADGADLPAAGCALDPALGTDEAVDVLGALYAVVAADLVHAGALRHLLEHAAAPALTGAVTTIMFGRSGSWAARSTHPVPRRRSRADAGGRPGVQVRLGTDEDLDVLTRLSLVEVAQRSTPPAYAPPAEDAPEAARRDRAGGLARGQVHLLARCEGQDVGLLCLEPADEHQRLIRHDQLYLGPAAVLPQARGTGVGSVLLQAAFTWGAERGYGWVGLAFAGPNELARRFWLGSGFQITGHVAIRSIHPAFGAP